MPIDPPTGFLTRPEAAKNYNRSQRALERDLDVALTIEDAETLAHWKLVTKDGQVRDGGGVTIDMVKRLVADGMSPAWCVSESFLHDKYGRKGEPRPILPASNTGGENDPGPARDEPTIPGETPSDEKAFLRGIVRRLEREKEAERDRHDRIIAKLFAELDVKNRQISAWDEVTQGLTKALATGRIAPNLGLLLAGSEPRKVKENVAEVPAPKAVPAGPAVEIAPRLARRPQQKSKRRAKPVARKVAKTRATRQRKAPMKERPAEKPRWYEAPTLKRFFSRSR